MNNKKYKKTAIFPYNIEFNPILLGMLNNGKINYDPLEHENELLYEIHNYKKTDELIKNYSNESKDMHLNIFNKEDFEKMADSLIVFLGKSEYFSI